MFTVVPPLFGTAHWGELMLVLVVILIIFGPKQLPKIGRALGGGIKEFKDGLKTGIEENDEEPSAPTSHTTVEAHPPEPLPPSEPSTPPPSTEAETVEPPRESSQP